MSVEIRVVVAADADPDTAPVLARVLDIIESLQDYVREEPPPSRQKTRLEAARQG
jgi:hypothetical protein